MSSISGVIHTQGDLPLKSWSRTFLLKYFSEREREILTKRKTLMSVLLFCKRFPCLYEYEIGLWMKSGGRHCIHYEPTFLQKCVKFSIKPSGAGKEEELI